tara:strand:- start:427 stop:1275 length:849 start_codon:yes stop_codon:yes gene_type:complete
MRILRRTSLKPFTTIRIGGISSDIYFPDSPDDLLSLKNIIALRKTIILGKGSNIAFKDHGYKHNIISLKYFNKKIIFNDNYINSMAGVSCARFAKNCHKNKISGFEFIHGIPGSIGGALAMNAGAFGDEIWNHVESVRCILNNGSLKTFQRNEIKTSYRFVNKSDIKMFLDVNFNINDSVKFDSKILSNYARSRSDSQPIKQWSSGCIFKNPSKKISASSLIDSASLETEKIGGIYISKKHCNYLINDGTGTCQDLEDLIGYIYNRIKKKYNILLNKEICIY